MDCFGWMQKFCDAFAKPALENLESRHGLFAFKAPFVCMERFKKCIPKCD